MDYDAVLAQVLALLQQEKRLSYRVLKRRLHLDDDVLEDLKEDLIYAKKLALDEDNRVLVWAGEHPSASAPPSDLGTPAQAAAPPADLARAPLAYTPPYLAEKILTSRSALEGERKQVTVLFADLKGSMELLADRDPEEARQLLDPVLERMMAAVHRYEGTVNQVMGDGIMALFGAPVAHEDHAVRACYAALAMQETIRRYSVEVRRTHGIEVQIRVGLNSGEVVVRVIGNDLHMDYSAIGQTTHLAARMEQLAPPGRIRLTADTLRLVEGLMQVTALGPVPVKGLAAPVEVFELNGASALRRRLQTAVARGLSPFVGRQPEMEALQQALARAGAGQGQVVALLGEPGVGKSRLVYEFLHSHHTPGWLRLESSSVSYGKATAYLPVCDLFKAYCQIEDRDALRTVQAKVTGQILTLDATLQDTIPAVLALFEALPADSPFLHLDPVQRRRRTLEALKRVLVRESQVQPLLLVFEDLHWIDSETQAVLDLLVESLPTARVLLLVNYRPEYQHGWGSKTFYTQLRLDPLPEASADSLLQALLGNDAGVGPLTQRLITRTQGNPFFLEESVRALVETGMLVGDRGAYRLAYPLDTLQVPATVQALLAARIDRLPPEDKRYLQTAAVIGTEVPLPLLQAIVEVSAEALQRGLEHLQAAEFLYETSLFPERAYTFKHALTHEVAYGSLLQERRRLLHACIVEALETLAGEQRDEVAAGAQGFPAGRQDLDQVERLAHHALRGEVWVKALAYCRQAGTKAMARSAYREAVTAFEQALGALPQLPESRARQEQAIDLRLDLRSALLPLGDEARMFDHVCAAEPLAEALGDPRRLALISYHLCWSFMAMEDYARAIAAGQRALALATASGAVDLPIMIQTRLGIVYNAAGDVREALHVARGVMAALEGQVVPARFGQLAPSSVTCRVIVARCLADLGAFAEGLVVAEAAVQMAEAVAQPYSIVIALHSVGLLSRCQGELHHAIPVLHRGLALCQDMHIARWLPLLASTLGVAYVLSGRTIEALPLLTQAREHVAAGRDGGSGESLILAELSEALLRVGRVEDASALADQLRDRSRTHPARAHQAQALRLLGDIALHRDPPEPAQAAAHYQQALVLAEEIGMRPLQTHCHRGLGMLYAMTGQREQARVELSTAVDLYQAMAMHFWLPETEAALAQVQEG